MFTGIITQVGNVKKISDNDNGKTFWITHQFGDLQIGESIAVNGICLTVTEFDQNIFKVDISPETLSCTNMSLLNNQRRVNLERSLQLSDRIGGHFVTGHVDQMASVCSITKMGDYCRFLISGVKTEYLPLLITKGSITINGVSLTINSLEERKVELMIIPHTWNQTNLAELKMHDWVNVEYDMIAKIIQAQLKTNKVYENI